MLAYLDLLNIRDLLQSWNSAFVYVSSTAIISQY